MIGQMEVLCHLIGRNEENTAFLPCSCPRCPTWIQAGVNKWQSHMQDILQANVARRLRFPRWWVEEREIGTEGDLEIPGTSVQCGSWMGPFHERNVWGFGGTGWGLRFRWQWCVTWSWDLCGCVAVMQENVFVGMPSSWWGIRPAA